jgi:hypothetical protein
MNGQQQEGVGACWVGVELASAGVEQNQPVPVSIKHLQGALSQCGMYLLVVGQRQMLR